MGSSVRLDDSHRSSLGFAGSSCRLPPDRLRQELQPVPVHKSSVHQNHPASGRPSKRLHFVGHPALSSRFLPGTHPLHGRFPRSSFTGLLFRLVG